jgi:hypothetical protein
LARRLLDEEIVVGACDDIDDRIADAEHVEAGSGHEELRWGEKARAL